MQRKSKRIVAGWLLIGIFSAVGIFMFLWQNPFTLEKASGTVLLKQSEQGLYTAPDYYALVLSPGEQISHTSLTEKQINEIEDYESLDGYKMGAHFYTAKGLITDLVLLGAMLLVSGYFILLGIHVIRSASRMDEPVSGWRKMFTWSVIKKFLFAIGILVALYFFGKFAVNVMNGTVGGSHIDTKAEITDKESVHHSGGRGFGHTTYTLSLEFEDEEGDQIRVIKDVHKNIFDQFNEDQHLAISYRDKNPYKITITKDTFSLGNLSSPKILFGTLLVIMILLAYLVSFFKKRKKG